MAFIDFLIVLWCGMLSRWTWAFCEGSGDRGALEAGKIRGGRVPEVGAGKSGRCRILKEGKWEENAQKCLISRDWKELKGGSQEKGGWSWEIKARDVLPCSPSVTALRVLSKSLLVHALGSKKSSQECLIWGKNVKFNFGKLSPAIFGFHLKFIWETLWPPKIKALPSRSTSKYCAVHICYPAR